MIQGVRKAVVYIFLYKDTVCSYFCKFSLHIAESNACTVTGKCSINPGFYNRYEVHESVTCEVQPGTEFISNIGSEFIYREGIIVEHFP